MSSARAAAPVRPWRGVSAEERTAARREALLQAGLEVFATQGYAASSVREVCREAGLTERYFYESFADREALLRALAERIVADFLAAVAPILPVAAADLQRGVREGAEAFVASLADDPRRARVLLVETVGVSPAAETERRRVIARLVAFLSAAAEQVYGPWVRESVEFELIVRSLIGAAQELLVAYVRGELQIGRDELVRHLVGLFESGTPILAAMAEEHAGTRRRATTRSRRR